MSDDINRLLIEAEQAAISIEAFDEIQEYQEHESAPAGRYEDSLNDNASASKFIELYGERLRYVYTWEKWLCWDGKRWSLSKGKSEAMRLSRTYAKQLFNIAAQQAKIGSPHADQFWKFAKSSNTKERIKAIEELSRTDDRVAISHDDLDAEPYLFNVQNGTLNLKTGELRGHRQDDRLTQLAAVTFNPEADCPLWCATLELIFAGNAELIRYLQTLFGYSLAGITPEHIIPICYGEGNNGKSTVWNAWVELMGDYGSLVSQDLLMPMKDQHPTEMADLFGKRFVAVEEPDQGRRLAEAKVKALTGDKLLKARRMREDHWFFEPTHTLWMATNHKPKITGTDTGIWRRLKLIPFTVDLSTVTTVDKDFPNKLKAEYPGILNWALEGWKRYQSEGLKEPEAVTQATSEYRNAEDELGEFIRETYIQNPQFQTVASKAWEAYQNWGGGMNQTQFGRELSKRYEKQKHTAGKHRNKQVYHGFGELDG